MSESERDRRLPPVRLTTSSRSQSNLSLDLLGLGPVPGSGIDPDQTLDVD